VLLLWIEFSGLARKSELAFTAGDYGVERSVALVVSLGTRKSQPEGSSPMTKHMPEAPPANRSPKGPGDPNTSEQGDTANIRQNTTNKGSFRGWRMK
jgi:hypothetical protein